MAKKPFEYKVTVHAESEAEAKSMITSATTMLSKLTPKEMERLAHIVKNEPITMAMVRVKLGL